MKIIHICGMAHSGSTLLGLLLGAHSKCFYAGEAKNAMFLSNVKIKKQKRSCKFCGDKCLIWTNVNPLGVESVHRQVAVASKCNVVVDSTKDSAWIKAQIIKNKENEIYLIYLQRDSSAVVNSRKRKYSEQSLDEVIDHCKNEKNNAELLYADFDGAKMIIPYQQLTADTEIVLRKICNFIGVDYEKNMLNWQNTEQHPLGGNNGTQWLFKRNQKTVKEVPKNSYYANHPGGIVTDNRWKHELTEEEQAIINKSFE